MAIEIRYRCCEHCANDPRYHEEYPPDSHDTTCSTTRGPLCPRGDQPVRFDTERNTALADAKDGS